MSVFQMNGLLGSHPLGALAAFGLLRVLTEQGTRPRLRFVERDDWVAEIDCELASIGALMESLSLWVQEPRERLLAWSQGDVRVRLEEYRAALASSLAVNDEQLINLLSSLAADGAVDKSKGLVKPTAFYMASGQQSFLEAMRALLKCVREDPMKAWDEALNGPWKYSASLWGAGWDPGTERMHALRHKAPSKDKTSCVPGAVWLAFEALPLFPSFSVQGRDRTVGFQERPRRWVWPVPDRAISLETLSLLVASTEVAKPGQRQRSGVGAIYESIRHEFGQGYGVFRPARRIA